MEPSLYMPLPLLLDDIYLDLLSRCVTIYLIYPPTICIILLHHPLTLYIFISPLLQEIEFETEVLCLHFCTLTNVSFNYTNNPIHCLRLYYGPIRVGLQCDSLTYWSYYEGIVREGRLKSPERGCIGSEPD